MAGGEVDECDFNFPEARPIDYGYRALKVQVLNKSLKVKQCEGRDNNMAP